MRVTLSVVSHRQNALVNALLADLMRGDEALAVVVTENVPDDTPLATPLLAGPLSVVRNEQPKGFGANHNAAFAKCATPFFCVANPDIRLRANPFPALVEALETAAAAGPLVRNPDGAIEDSARRFPTPVSLARKLLRAAPGPEYPIDRGPQVVDWVAGMFALFDTATFGAIGGFDERYFLYYEDVEICRRLARGGHRVLYVPGAEVVHDARRASRREPALARHHLRSALRFLTT
jgi:N-acetylglucosaminyl-diphospho-decaprenol L-rhamnosyltransferase